MASYLLAFPDQCSYFIKIKQVMRGVLWNNQMIDSKKLSTFFSKVKNSIMIYSCVNTAESVQQAQLAGSVATRDKYLSRERSKVTVTALEIIGKLPWCMHQNCKAFE